MKFFKSSRFCFSDWLCIISGEWILFINPHQPKDEVCLLRKIANLDTKTIKALSNIFEGTFNFSVTCLQRGYFDGTLFWLPLRQDISDLSDIVYTGRDIVDLFRVFVDEAKITLLFVKSLESISLLQRNDSADIETMFVVRIATQFLQDLQRERRKFKLELDNTGDSVAKNSFHSKFHLCIEHTEFGEQSTVTSQEWLVVNFYKGRCMSDRLRQLCGDSDLSYSPYVGVAYPLTDTGQMNGHIFCFLPLPRSSESATGLPVHVNGFFALTQDRREVKWSNDDGKQDQWNQCLISEVIPDAYTILIEELKQLIKTRNNCTDMIQLYYRSLPDSQKVAPHWKHIVEPLYDKLFQMTAFFSEVNGGTWLTWENVILTEYSADTELDVRATVTKTYLDYQQSVVQLPTHIVNRIRTRVPCVNPEQLCELLKTSDKYTRYSRSERKHLLNYALQSPAHSPLRDLSLLPVADGTFQTFSQNEVFFCPKRVHLFPGLENILVAEHLEVFEHQQLGQMAKRGVFSMFTP